MVAKERAQGNYGSFRLKVSFVIVQLLLVTAKRKVGYELRKQRRT